MRRAPVATAADSRRLGGVLAAVLLAASLGACSADIGQLDGSGPLASAAPPSGATADGKKVASKTEMQKALEYWGKEHQVHPTDLKAALAYARNLKASGSKREALDVLQSASLVHGDSRELDSEYGRLALDLGQVQLASQLLAVADDPAKPDWKIVSARGTVQAKLGNYLEAIPFYQKALELSPEQPSVLNNLAMAYAASGEADKAEPILRKLAAKDGDPKVRQNLALVLGLSGKGDAATPAAPQVAVPAAPDAAPAAPLAAPVAAAPAKAKAKVADARPSKPNGMRETKEPTAVSAGPGGWATSVARAD